MKVAVIGAGGYAGGELLRLLAQHPEVTEWVAVSRSQAGKPVADVHPALTALSDATFHDGAPGEVARGRDVVFLALEHGESSRLAGEIFAADPGLVVDLAADFRVRDPSLHERYYGVHAAPELRSRFVYGLADICGPSLQGARAIAVPGCFATAAELALYPLARVGLAAARNTRPFLIQCYRRDMGGGAFALMKDASAPIVLAGRHWGSLRVGYRT